jgi:hypothetical protein
MAGGGRPAVPHALLLLPEFCAPGLTLILGIGEKVCGGGDKYQINLPGFKTFAQKVHLFDAFREPRP